MTDADRRDELLRSQLSSLDAISSVGYSRASRNVSINVDGERDDLPKHVKKLADRYDRTLVFRETNDDGLGGRVSIFELASDDRLDALVSYAEKHGDETYDVIETDGGTTTVEADDVDDSKDCGRRTCDADADVTYTTKRGAIRTRCAVHALADGVSGIGDSRAETIIDKIALPDLVDRCENADGAHCPTVLSKISGLGPTSAAKIAVSIDESNVAAAVRDDR